MLGIAKLMGLAGNRPFMEEDPISMYMDADMDDEAISMMEMLGGGSEQLQTKVVHTDFFNEFEDDFDDDDLN